MNEDEINTQMVEKEKEITECEQALDVVEGSIIAFKRDSLLIDIKRQDLMPDYKKAKHNLSRFRRELDSLKRAYFRSRRI